MVDINTYIKEGLKIVKTLISQGNLQAALGNCAELLRINPYHRKTQKFFKKIETLIIENNEKKVKQDIKATMHLWKENRLEDLMQIYSRLYRFAPQYKPLRKLMEKLDSRLSTEKKNERAAFVDEALKAIKKLLHEEKFSDAIQASNELLSIAPINETAADCLNQAKQGLIKLKFKENAAVAEGADFERIIDFCEGILAINPNHTKAKNLLFQAKTHLAEQKIIAGKIHLNESIIRMEKLFKDGEYEKVLQACEEILRLDPHSVTAKIFRRKATKNISSEIERLSVKKLQEAYAALRPEYDKNPGEFVKM